LARNLGFIFDEHHFLTSTRLQAGITESDPPAPGQTPEPIFTQYRPNDVDSRKDVPFAVKIATFHTHDL